MSARLAILGLVTLAGILFSQPLTEAQSIKIAYIDIEKMVEDSERVKKVIEPLEKKYTAQASKFDEQKSTLEERLRSYKNRASTEGVEDPELERELQNIVADREQFLREVKSEAQEFARQQEENLRPLLLEIRQQLQSIGRERGLDFIFRKQDLPYVNEKYDITEDVMDRIDRSVAEGRVTQ
jgi:outer membrane protein